MAFSHAKMKFFCFFLVALQLIASVLAINCNEECKLICQRNGNERACVEACGCKWIPGFMACDEECKLICLRNGGKILKIKLQKNSSHSIGGKECVSACGCTALSFQAGKF
jgi:hypothetical protein